MECTQRLEFTQELYESRSERTCPEQIGFLGICGEKHPVKRGPNKIGRDPHTCSIVINLNSISRQHAVINVLNQTEYMLMDLDSANKTKLMNKTLPAYIPHPLKDGDMVQFGDVFGVFRLLEDDNDLPMTQAIDIPETPIATRHISKLNKGPVTTVPESPDVSDREESFIAPSQPKGENCFKNSNKNHFVKPSAKVISIQPVGSSKIDNVYWNSSKKSVSLTSQFNDSGLNDSAQSDHNASKESNAASIHEMETQLSTADANDSVDSIYTANTQVPSTPDSIYTADTQIPTKTSDIHTADTQVPTIPLNIHTANTQVETLPLNIHTADTQVSTIPLNIHTADTQVSTIPLNIHTADTQVPTMTANIHTADTQIAPSPPDIHTADTQIPSNSPDIHTVDTQVPVIKNLNLPEVCKVDNQREMEFNLFTSNKNSVKKSFEKFPTVCKVPNEGNKKLNVSDEEILFDELDCQEFDDDFASQPLLPSEPILVDDMKNCVEKEAKSESTDISKKRKDVIIHSDSSTDCEDIDMLPTQNITKTNVNDDEDLTDCEDLFGEVPKTNNKPTKGKIINANFEDMLTQVIDDVGESNIQTNVENKDVDIEDMLTQVIVPQSDDKKAKHVNVEDIPTQIIVEEDGVFITENQTIKKDSSFEDMPTQVICDVKESTSSTKGQPKQKEELDFVSPFKIPLISPIKIKRRDIKVITPKSKLVINSASPICIPEEDENYYAATQDIMDDLCSQKESLPDAKNPGVSNNGDDDFVPSSVEDYVAGSPFPHLDNLSPRKKINAANKSSESSDGEENVNNYVSKLSSQQIRDVIGAESKVNNLKRTPSDPSDVELTPKKVKPIKFMDIDLPSSQEIKTSVSVYNKAVVTESSSESEMENDSEECTPILFRKKSSKIDARVDLTKVFETESLPTRVMTRVRKPTTKLQNSDDVKKLTNNILKPKFLTEQEDDIDNDIVTENLTRLKNKTEKSKNKAKDSKEEIKKPDQIKSEKENTSISEKVTSKSKTKANTKSVKSDKDNSKQKHKEVSNLDMTDKTKKTISTDAINISSKIEVVDKQVTNVIIDTSTVSRSTRSTRNRRKPGAAKDIGENSPIEGDDSQNQVKSRRQNNKKPAQIDLTEEVIEVRRSSRQKPVKEKKEKVSKKTERSLENVEKKKRGRPPKHEQSTVYSLSSDSSADSPRNAKRSATADLDAPSSKRTRSAANISNSSLRSTPARVNKNHYVLFTAFPSEEVKAKLEKLGASVVSDVNQCTVVLTMQVKRTFKLLCAVGLGRPIVGPSWVQACVDTNMVVDPWLYLLKDEAAEKRFQFSLEKTLIGKRNFLKDYNVSATPNVMPSAPEMKMIVESSGGTWKDEGPSWICVSCSADKSLWPALKRRGATVVSTEFILGGVLRQRADVATNKLH